MSARLCWQARGDGWRAECGEEGQGRVRVYPMADGGWSFRLDMLPGDSEPVVQGRRYASPAGAKLAAARQVAAWPALIDGASR